MATVSHEQNRAGRRWAELLIPEMWASLAISVIWLAVLFDAVFGPDFVSSTPGSTSSVIPSVIFIAPFACLATWVVAKYGVRGARKE